LSKERTDKKRVHARRRRELAEASRRRNRGVKRPSAVCKARGKAAERRGKNVDWAVAETRRLVDQYLPEVRIAVAHAMTESARTRDKLRNTEA